MLPKVTIQKLIQQYQAVSSPVFVLQSNIPIFKKWSFSYKFTFEVLWKKEKGKSFFEGKKLILFSDVEKGKGKSFSEGKKLILFS